ncbi:hypothetical protein [Enterobacter sp. HNGD-822]
MKLIDIVIMELSKRGGWPEKAACVVQDADTQICFSAKIDGLRKTGTDWIGGEWNGPWINFFSNHLADDHSTSIVTKEQYEAALADSKQAWNGDGLPPVGTEAEVSVDGGRTWCSYKATSECNGMRLVEIGNFTEEFQSNNWMFRPIRSEADKKKETVEKAIADALFKDGDFDYAEALRLSTFVYGAMSRKEIPHIRID